MMTPARTRSARRLLCAFALVLLSGLATGPAYAQPNTGKVSFNTGVDFSHAYFYRHFKQARDGFVAQPYAEMNFNLYSDDDGSGLSGIIFTLGQWNSLHTGETGSGRTLSDGGAGNAAAWYESDYYGGVTLGIDNWEAGITYTSLLSPNDSFTTVQELAFGLAMDDSSLLGPLSLQPHVLMVIEIKGQTDGGDSEGVYLEFGIEPGRDIIDGWASISFPVSMGLSLSNYYENGISTDTPLGFNDNFGHFDAGAVIAVPLGMPEAYGSWELTGGIHLMKLGSYLREINDGDDTQAVGSLGFSVGY